MTDITDLKAKAETATAYDGWEDDWPLEWMTPFVALALIAEREADAAWMAEARRLLGDARDLVEKWCHYQGNTPALFDQYLGPIDAFLAKSPQSDKEA